MKLRGILALLAALCILAAPAAAAGGDGTSANPYQIETAAELQSIQNDLSAHYILMNDIDLTGVTWTPIGSTSAGFFGELDGNGHTISNLTLSATTQSAGLFSSLTSGATIKDLTLEDCHVESTAAWCGCLVGSIIMSESAHETATLQIIEMIRCSATSRSYNVGVLCGTISTAAVVDIADCTLAYCNAESTNGINVAVLCGNNGGSSTEITDCIVSNSHAKAELNAVSVLCGQNSYGNSLIMRGCMVDTCIAESNSSYNVGILCAVCNTESSVFAENCTAENSVTKAATNNAGGLFGLVTGTGSSIGASGCTVKDCTVVATGNYAGGIAGRVESGSTGVFDSCTVTGCSILANAYAAGVCPAYS